MASEKMWLPLESNPVVMESYLTELGARKGEFQVCDVYGLDEELLSMVPPTAVAVLMLFPLTNKLTSAIDSRDRAQAADQRGAAPSNLFFMEQLVGNACGTIGLLHAIINNQLSASSQPRIGITEGSFIANFMAKVIRKDCPLSPLDIGRVLAGSNDLDSLHSLAAENGQSALPDEMKGEDDPHNRVYHFIAFVEKDGFLWELDGRRPYPHRWGPCGSSAGDSLLKASSHAIEWFMQQDPDNIQFGLTALVANAE